VKYADLPKEETVQKLVATSFESPSLNWAVYDWSEKILKHIQFLENERVKLVKRYGEADAQGNYKVPNEKLPEFQKPLRNAQLQKNLFQTVNVVTLKKKNCGLVRLRYIRCLNKIRLDGKPSSLLFSVIVIRTKRSIFGNVLLYCFPANI
jgi:hypothetical protein